ncbi:MAG: ASKHA domain-containing protein [bacterium]
MTDTVQIVFTPSGKRGQVALGKSVLEAAQQLGVDLDTVCGGRGLCDRCQIDQSVGEFAKFGIHSTRENLSAFSAIETEFFGANATPTRRLGCQAKLRGDAVIDVPPESQAHRQVVRKRAEVHGLTLDPAVRLHYVEVPQPNMHDPSGDLQRLLDALEFEWGLSDLECDFHILDSLQRTLRDGEWKVTAAVHRERHLIALWPGLKPRAYGIAVDVGSTTIAAHLCDLISGEAVAAAGRMNPQIRFGEDLMSRVSYAMMNPGGEADMTRAVREALQGLIEEVAAQADVGLDEVLDVVLVGNPVMHHLLLGINPVELGGAPFALATDQSVNARAGDLQLNAARGARVYLLPCIAGHVGADAAAVALSEAPYARAEMTLVVDVGTNDEIVLGNQDKMVAASSPTGPAFEGAQISGGQRAAPGAIERVRIDRETLEPRFRIIGCDAWSDEDGFASGAADDAADSKGAADSDDAASPNASGDNATSDNATADNATSDNATSDNVGGATNVTDATDATSVTGICGSGIIEAIAEMFLAGIIKPDGVIDGALADKSPRLQRDGKTWRYVLYADASKRSGPSEIYITQNDVRAIQLAKAALYAGARLLMDKLGIERLDRIRLAGAFGAHIDVKYAMTLGMIPDCELAHVTSAGNAAGAGAIIALLDQAARREIEDVVKRIEKIETAVEPKFQHHFVEALAIPHKTAQYENLRREVALPQRTEAASESNGAKRRRRRR